MAVKAWKSLIFAGLVASLVTGCEPGTFGMDSTTEPLADAAATADGGAVAPARSVKLVDRDVEAPDDFQTTDKALWDGRPSLGGVWVAATNVSDPMRVIMRNPANGKFVIGALFRREADNPGPKLQISSDAADALGLVAGEPAMINVTALRREEMPAATPDATRPLLDTTETIGPEVDVAATASSAIEAAVAEQPAAPAADPAAEIVAEPVAVPAAEAPATPSTDGKAIQIGIFSLEDNAKRAVAKLAKAGIPASIRKDSSLGKDSWGVITSGDKALLAKIKEAGFADAYFL